MKSSVKKIGIVGSNLTAVLLAEEARKKGFHTTLLEEKVQHLAVPFVDEQIVGELNSSNIERLMLRSDRLLFCTPHIPSINRKYEKNCTVYPSKDLAELMNNRVLQVKLAGDLEIPVPNYYYQNNKEVFFDQIEEIDYPFTFYQVYDDHYECMEVNSTEELGDLIFEMDEDANEWMIEEIEAYKSILNVTVLKKGNQICFYPITEEVQGEEEVQTIYAPARISKTLGTKVERYVKKILKNIEAEGLVTFKFGLTQGKKIALIHMSPGVTVGDIATNYYCNVSIYEQVMHMLMDLPLQNVVVKAAAKVTIVKDADGVMVPEGNYHMYVLDKAGPMPIRIYIEEVVEV